MFRSTLLPAHTLVRSLAILVLAIPLGTGCGAGGGDWSPEEREAARRLVTALTEIQEVVQIHNRVGMLNVEGEDRERVVHHVNRAREAVDLVNDTLLDRVHPELPPYFRLHLRPAIREYFLWYETGLPEFVGAGPMHFNDWSRWYGESRDDWELP